MITDKPKALLLKLGHWSYENEKGSTQLKKQKFALLLGPLTKGPVRRAERILAYLDQSPGLKTKNGFGQKWFSIPCLL